ncbi:DUF3846 domain-containing protein [Frigoribacterium sp. 9N]|uniref:DUF3846 domain-containing protein n=1 Tax=Frigoribacterium sp. 9N TaxID=2653144 RepID=UPI0012F30439|nr:DUF3846 domain-containing protein [Frigoribacterium sp. 9N]VXB66982.1 conserved hypothetical protein [Frigoribacterium sp. 9N]
MVKSIVIPHDTAQPPRMQELADIGSFQEVVDGWLELVDVPGVGATIYVNEEAQRHHAPANTRAMAIRWLYSADPMEHPLLCGDIVISGIPDENEGDVPATLVRDIFEATQFFIDAQWHYTRLWKETRARFDNVFDAAVWCLLLSRSARPGVQFRVRPQVPGPL